MVLLPTHPEFRSYGGAEIAPGVDVLERGGGDVEGEQDDVIDCEYV